METNRDFDKMFLSLPEPPVGRVHFDFVHRLLDDRCPFVFTRFSDGEMEIVRNQRLIIGESTTEWRKGTLRHSYPLYDRKTFEPARHARVRQDLIASAELCQSGYFKGIPTSHNNAVDDRDLMVGLNGGSVVNLTFADLFLNENYTRFVKAIVPTFSSFKSVMVVGNFRMVPGLMNPEWTLAPIPDDFFMSYLDVKASIMKKLREAPEGGLILSSASSLSNVLGSEVSSHRPDLTFLDVGTTLHGLMGMDSRIRQYHVDLEPWRFRNIHKKLRNRLAHGYRLQW